MGDDPEVLQAAKAIWKWVAFCYPFAVGAQSVVMIGVAEYIGNVLADKPHFTVIIDHGTHGLRFKVKRCDCVHSNSRFIADGVH
ncbi:hypothetical protein ADT30_10545 [Xylella fastidiosa]|nr:hypothetical protein ADT30_10545 [Xylella fastidiosa]